MDHWIDHLVLAAPSLDAGVAHVMGLMGVAPVFGGAHPGVGTCNALASLGAPTYLEVIAPDPGQPGLERRSFELDRPPAEPRLVAFAVGCADIDATVATLRAGGHRDVADPFEMTRRLPDDTELRWRLVILAPGPGGAHPFLISWGDGPSPADDSPPGGRLVGMRAGDPDPDARRDLLRMLAIDVPIDRAAAPWLTATIETPSGTVTLR